VLLSSHIGYHSPLPPGSVGKLCANICTEKKDKERGKDGILIVREGGLDPTRRQLRNFRPLPH
jgi:hypothetical protein